MNRKSISCLCLCILFIICSTGIVEAAASYQSYIYTMARGRPSIAISPVPFIPSRVIDSKVLGVPMMSPQDIAQDAEGNFYITDAGTNSIICVDSHWKIIKVISTFMNGNKEDTFNKPEGAFITENGNIFIADTENNRIVVLDKNHNLVQLIHKPESDVLPKDFKFYPKKVAVDGAGRIFTVSRGVFEGLVEFYSDGKFSGFIGSIPVNVDPVELFWKSIMTKEQKSKMIRFVPVEYTNLFLDRSGFIYTVSLSETNKTPIRRLNPSGKDVLIRNPVVELPIAGDAILDYSGGIYGPSAFVDICADSNDIYYGLDAKRGRVFAYDSDGNLLFVFGGISGDQVGTFKIPTAITLDHENIVVADGEMGRITIFEPTQYAQLVKEGAYNYQVGNYEKSIEAWQNVLKYNSNFDLAYHKIGKIFYRQEKYKEAMRYFTLAYDKESYSTAHFADRKEWLRENFGKYMTWLAVGIILIFILKKLYGIIDKRVSLKRMGGRNI